MSNYNRSLFQGHPFHLVSPSPWPLLTCTSLLCLTTSFVSSIHGFSGGIYFATSALILLVSSMSFWFRDVISEGRAKSLSLHLHIYIISLNHVFSFFYIEYDLL